MATKTKKAKNTTVTPLDDRIVVLPDTADDRTESGIYLPEAAKEKPQTGKVIAAGPGKLTDTGERGALSVKKGDTVLFGKYAGSEVDIDGVEHKIMRESELLAIMEK
jgi:chaperonin GroES